MNFKKYMYIIIFFVVLFIPLMGMPFYHPDTSKENRNLTAFPKIIMQDKINLNYFEQLTDWFSDHFAFRQELATVNNVLNVQFFSTAVNEKVIIGKTDTKGDAWLFFSEELDDYQGTARMTPRQLSAGVRTLELMQEYAENHGCNFLFTVAPNKSSIYPEYMPNYLKRNKKQSNAEALCASLSVCKVNALNLFSLLTEQKHIDENVYHKTDSHWNKYGAFLSANAILEQLGRTINPDMPVADTLEYDIYNMIYPASDLGKDLDYASYIKNDNTDYQVLDEDGEIMDFTDVKKDDFLINTINDKGQGNALIFRDSFGNALHGFLANAYEQSIITREVPYDLTKIEQYNIDDVIIELVERHINTLYSEVPIFDAPEKEFEASVSYAEGVDALLQYSEYNEYLYVTGYCNPEYTDDDSPVYLCVSNENETLIFEATPAADAMQLSDMDYEAGYGFGAYIPLDMLAEDNYSIELMTQKDKEWYITKETAY